MNVRFLAALALAMPVWAGQDAPKAEPAADTTTAWRKAETDAGRYVVEGGTRIPLSLINTVSTKNAADGDRVYLETAFPILSGGRVVIPPGSYVAGTITAVKRPGRVKGKGELFLRFDSLTLPNGVTRDFRARIGGIDGNTAGQLDRREGKINSDGGKGDDARTVAEAAVSGTTVGAIVGSISGHPGMGVGVGAAAGAAAGLMGVMLSRGADAVLMRGSTVEMLLDRSLSFTEEELDFSRVMPRGPRIDPAPLPVNQRDSRVPGRRWPL